MKICRYNFKDLTSWGVVNNNLVTPIENFENLNRYNIEADSSENININEIKLLPPVTPSKIVCVGRNYAAHAAELGNAVPKEPLLFLKAPSSIITEGDVINLPKQSNRVEHEGELGVVIGRTCRNLSDTANSLNYVLGYTCLNDVTARDLQLKDVQFTRAKSFDTFCPIGAFIETELDASDIRVLTRVNGKVKQDGLTSQMIFSVQYLITYISNQMTLNPGDVIATGTPSGVSELKSGDICEIEIQGVGILRNPIA